MADLIIHKAELDLAVAFHKVAVAERDLARAQLRDARADLREAVELIRLTCSGYESPEWKEQAAELLHRHKETQSG